MAAVNLLCATALLNPRRHALAVTEAAAALVGRLCAARCEARTPGAAAAHAAQLQAVARLAVLLLGALQGAPVGGAGLGVDTAFCLAGSCASALEMIVQYVSTSWGLLGPAAGAEPLRLALQAYSRLVVLAAQQPAARLGRALLSSTLRPEPVRKFMMLAANPLHPGRNASPHIYHGPALGAVHHSARVHPWTRPAWVPLSSPACIPSMAALPTFRSLADIQHDAWLEYVMLARRLLHEPPLQ